MEVNGVHPGASSTNPVVPSFPAFVRGVAAVTIAGGDGGGGG